ncbi:MAG: hypothetical protein KGK09_10045 [Burkholderiales bacterium]|nr:hypothetical protein [Burkholderiales bacterium]
MRTSGRLAAGGGPVIVAPRREQELKSGGRPLSLRRRELQARLQAQGLAPQAPLIRHLLFVHDTVQASGWRRVEVLPSRVLAKAVAPAREARAAQGQPLAPAPIEVSEVSAEEFAALERSWQGVAPPGLGRGDGGSRP